MKVKIWAARCSDYFSRRPREGGDDREKPRERYSLVRKLDRCWNVTITGSRVFLHLRSRQITLFSQVHLRLSLREHLASLSRNDQIKDREPNALSLVADSRSVCWQINDKAYLATWSKYARDTIMRHAERTARSVSRYYIAITKWIGEFSGNGIFSIIMTRSLDVFLSSFFSPHFFLFFFSNRRNVNAIIRRIAAVVAADFQRFSRDRTRASYATEVLPQRALERAS